MSSQGLKDCSLERFSKLESLVLNGNNLDVADVIASVATVHTDGGHVPVRLYRLHDARLPVRPVLGCRLTKLKVPEHLRDRIGVELRRAKRAHRGWIDFQVLLQFSPIRTAASDASC